MRRLRLLALLVAAGVLITGLPALVRPPPAVASTGHAEASAVLLLQQAARAARTRSWHGTQYVASWRGGTTSSAVLDVAHDPARGTEVRGNGKHRGPAAVTGTAELDARAVALLAEHYDLAITGRGRCAGRRTWLVEARRPGAAGAAPVAGRFWLDDASGVVLRREVYDTEGDLLHSSAFVDVRVSDPVPQDPTRSAWAPEAPPTGTPTGWVPPRVLAGLSLVDTRLREHEGARVLHAAYSDGLSTVSVFAQPGRLPSPPRDGFVRERVGDRDVWVRGTTPERVVWSGNGSAFTLVSDADPATVRQALVALPHDPPPRDGLLARLGRGLARLGSWLNPFA